MLIRFFERLSIIPEDRLFLYWEARVFVFCALLSLGAGASVADENLKTLDGQQVLRAEGVIVDLCREWRAKDWEHFSQLLLEAELGFGIPEFLPRMYFAMDCHLDVENTHTSLMRIAMISPKEFWSRQRDLYKHFMSEPGGAEAFSCALHIREQQRNLMEYIDFKIDGETTRLNTIQDETRRKGIERAIKAWERRLKQYQEHLAMYPVDPSQCPPFPLCGPRPGLNAPPGGYSVGLMPGRVVCLSDERLGPVRIVDPMDIPR
jgi:hypothetical protein